MAAAAAPAASAAKTTEPLPTGPRVEWADDGTGYEIYEHGGRSLVYRRDIGIQSTIHTMANQIVSDPMAWKLYLEKDGAEPPSLNQRYTADGLRRIHPKLSWFELGTLNKGLAFELRKYVPEAMKKHYQSGGLGKTPEDDYGFLLDLGAKRNWKSGCAICLTDKITGTTCGCGHTEIAVFRPCGHTICANPCFEEFMKSKGAPALQPQNVVIAGKVMQIVGKNGYHEVQRVHMSTVSCRGAACVPS